MLPKGVVQSVIVAFSRLHVAPLNELKYLQEAKLEENRESVTRVLFLKYIL